MWQEREDCGVSLVCGFFTFRNGGKVWRVVKSLEFFGISNGISIET